MLSIIVILNISKTDLLAQETSGDKLLGIWLMANKNVKVEIINKGGVYHGIIVWMDTDANTKNFSLGGTIIDQMYYNIDTDNYTGGYFYGRGYQLNCKLKVIDDHTVEIKVSKGILRKTKYATKSQL